MYMCIYSRLMSHALIHPPTFKKGLYLHMPDPSKKMFSNERYSDSPSTALIYGESGINDGEYHNTFQTDKDCYKGLAPTRTRELCVILLLILVQFMGISADTLLLPFFPHEMSSRGVSKVLVGFIFGVYSFARFTVSPFCAKLVSERNK